MAWQWHGPKLHKAVWAISLLRMIIVLQRAKQTGRVCIVRLWCRHDDVGRL